MNELFVNGVLYLCIVAGAFLMLIGGTRKHIKHGFITIMIAYLGLNLNSLAKSGTLNSVIVSAANYFGVTPNMFAINVFIGANLAFILFYIFPSGRSKGNQS